MSVCAWNINEAVGKHPSFNVWRDHELIDFMDEEGDFFSQLTNGGVGFVIVEVKVIRKALREAVNLNLSENTVKQLKQDIAFAKAKKDDTVTYHCF